MKVTFNYHMKSMPAANCYVSLIGNDIGDERDYINATTAYRAACRIGKRIAGYHFMTVHQK